MARPQASGFATRTELRRRERLRFRRLRALALLGLAGAILVPILILVFDSAETTRSVPLPPAERLLPAGPPTPQVVAFQGSLRLYLPIAESRVTAIGYHSVGEGALALDPVGSQANAGLFTRLFNRFFGDEEVGIRYYLLGDGPGPDTAGLDIGAPVGTDVYAPVGGSVIGISEHVVSGGTYGVRIDIQPAGSPGLVVSLVNIRLDQALTVGSSVAASRTRLGSVIDLSRVETPALARYTQDLGQHVHIEVRPTANLSLP
jgi:hypothetical protein